MVIEETHKPLAIYGNTSHIPHPAPIYFLNSLSLITQNGECMAYSQFISGYVSFRCFKSTNVDSSISTVTARLLLTSAGKDLLAINLFKATNCILYLLLIKLTNWDINATQQFYCIKSF